jgi:hypothetical protein
MNIPGLPGMGPSLGSLSQEYPMTKSVMCQADIFEDE